MGLCHAISADDPETKESLGRIFVPMSERDPCGGADWAKGDLLSHSQGSHSSTFHKTGRDSQHRDSQHRETHRERQSEETETAPALGAAPPAHVLVARRRSSGAGKPKALHSRSVLVMRSLKHPYRGSNHHLSAAAVVPGGADPSRAGGYGGGGVGSFQGVDDTSLAFLIERPDVATLCSDEMLGCATRSTRPGPCPWLFLPKLADVHAADTTCSFASPRANALRSPHFGSLSVRPLCLSVIRGEDTFADWREALRGSRSAVSKSGGKGRDTDKEALPCCSCLIRGPSGEPLIFVMSANWAAESLLVGYAETLARTLSAARAAAANERARAAAQLRDHRRFLVREPHRPVGHLSGF